MSCNTKTSLAAVIDAVNAQLNNNYVDRDDPRINQGVFTEPTIRGGLMLDEAAKLDFCGYVTECGQREPFGKQWVDRPLYPYNTLVSYDDEGEIKSRWQDTDDVVAGTEIGKSYTTYEETRSLGLQGYTIIDSFELGATLTQRDQALRHAVDGKLYRWAGDLPKVVPASSTPTSTGGFSSSAWLDVSDTTLRQELSAPSGGLFIPNIVIEFATLQSAVNASWLPVGATIKTISYHDGWEAQTSPPKGGNTYIKVAGGTGVADGGAYIDCPDGTQLKGLFTDGTLNITQYGAKADGTTDDTLAIQNALINPYWLPVDMPQGIIGITDTIQVGAHGDVLRGVSKSVKSAAALYACSTLKWLGGEEPRKSMVVVGGNDVGAEPTVPGSSNVLQDVFLDGDYKVGFLCYSTYITNDTHITNVGGIGSTEYNFYFARGWYANINQIFSRGCKNNGIAIGMPLVYSDGTEVVWTTQNPIEMNQCFIRDIRSNGAGENFSRVTVGSNAHRFHEDKFQGYGIAVGAGNGLTVSNWLTENTGGIGLYTLNYSTPSKVMDKGYIEKSQCYQNSAGSYTANGETVTAIYIDNSRMIATTSGHMLKDTYVSTSTGGGIRTNRAGMDNYWFTLDNVQAPAFMRDYTGDLSHADPDYPLQWIDLNNSSYRLGRWSKKHYEEIMRVNDKSLMVGWAIDNIPYSTGSKMLQVFIKTPDFDIGAAKVAAYEGTTSLSVRPYPTNLVQGVWCDVTEVLGRATKLTYSTATDTEVLVDFRLVKLKDV